jgi:outer membrane receptor protein involved in Fe transport
MPHRFALSCTLMLGLSSFMTTLGAQAQSGQVSARGPRFLLAAWTPGRELDASSAPVLRRRVSLDLHAVTVDQALKELTRQAALEISYSPRVVTLDRRVSLRAEGITVAAALTELLLDEAVDVSVTTGGALALVARAHPSAAPIAPDTGTITGQVRDRATGSALAGATVSLEGARLSTSTNALGRYRMAGVPAGTYAVRARFIGYTSLVTSAVVNAGQEATIDFQLGKSAQPLEQVVVTGTLVPTEVRALPTPISVITESDIAEQRPRTVAELYRQAIPGAVGWDLAAFPSQTTFAARGATTLNTGGGQMKVFVDGIEQANPTGAAVDPNSIDHIEVIRGPQAAAIYGSEAIGGVIQIFTKRGDPALQRPQIDAQAAAGVVQTDYAGRGEVLHQQYTAGLRGAAQHASYNIGAGYTRTGDYLPSDEVSRQSSPSAFGGIRFAQGVMSVDLSGRYYSQRNPQVFNPAFFTTGFVPFSKPNYQPVRFDNQTIGARVVVSPWSWWQHTITAGIDRFSSDLAQVQPRLTTPSDTLLQVSQRTLTKTSIGYSSALQSSLGANMTGSLTLGVDHWYLPLNQTFTTGALNSSGTIQTAPGTSFTFRRTVTNSTGYFAQAQLALHNALFLTGGLRAEENSEFGDSLATPLSPRIGLAYSRRVGQATIKARSSWGRAIRAPAPGQKLEFVTPTSITLANPTLGPERQQGWDAGLDVFLGRRASLSVTYYNQTAENLIQLVLLQSQPIQTFQNQNVARVRNTGVEVQAAWSEGRAKLSGQFAYSRARVADLGDSYAGDLRAGDQALGTPKYTAGGALTLMPFEGTSLSGALTYVGGFSNYDYVAQFSCFGGTGPCLPTSRDYIVQYPGFVKVNVNLSQDITPAVRSFISVANLTNSDAYELFNFAPVMGRVTTVGLQFHY